MGLSRSEDDDEGRKRMRENGGRGGIYRRSEDGSSANEAR